MRSIWRESWKNTYQDRFLRLGLKKLTVFVWEVTFQARRSGCFARPDASTRWGRRCTWSGGRPGSRTSRPTAWSGKKDDVVLSHGTMRQPGSSDGPSRRCNSAVSSIPGRGMGVKNNCRRNKNLATPSVRELRNQERRIGKKVTAL